MAVDTIFICACESAANLATYANVQCNTCCTYTVFLPPVEDYERNDGSKEKPYFMSDNLKKLLGAKNKFEDTDVGEGVMQMESVETNPENPDKA